VPTRDFDSAVPVRVRVEHHNSLNNRFHMDPLLRNRWATWQRSVAAMAGHALRGLALG
jgi:hypothetical protein